ncbi:hypothetical protein [Catellatospora citrea]|uniref:Uncharacterized protein n=1 Tax=Catellatospora citrea TaxID=53366 RepID=A0A8J3KA19_9ACTN|nr:hypothetical protein [Catellatospora citrea]RKE05549.1 hypothetical protein C8E86_0352 [Catellatospora citrea]GIF96899.1 hypothetical protein Cci01nite_19930 [Catellatospora citrea]
MTTRRTRWTATAVAVLLALTSAGCSKEPESRDSTAPSGYRLDGRELTEGEFRYGLAPQRHPDVTYQPDVVLVGGGANAIRSVTADGMTWTLDPDADGVSDLAVGKVMFATSRAVGRIVDLHDSGAGTVASIAPVTLTDVVRDGVFDGDQPIALDDRAIAFSSEGADWHSDAPPSAAPSAVALGAAMLPLRRDDKERVEQPRPVNGAPKQTRANGFRVTPMCCDGGVGAHLTFDEDGIRLVATVVLVMDKPSARFHLAISGGRIQAAELQVHGGGGIKVDVEGASTVGTDRQLNRQFSVPVDFSVPVGLVLGMPFTLSASQDILVNTAFSAKDGNIRASGEYALAGTLGFGYRDGSWGVHTPTKPVIRSSLLESVKGLSVGANGIVLAYKTTFSLGIGTLGFRAGLNFSLTVSTGVSRGSALAQFFPLAPGTRGVDCRGATLAIDATYNVGYSIPAPVAAVVNFFLRVFKAKPVQRTGGIPDPAGKVHIFDASQFEPAGCK